MKREVRLAVKFAVDVETNIEDDELLEIHAAEVVRRAIGYEIATPARDDGSVRLLGVFEGVDARLVR